MDEEVWGQPLGSKLDYTHLMSTILKGFLKLVLVCEIQTTALPYGLEPIRDIQVGLHS